MPSASPAGSSGTGTGSTANVYAPTMQPQADMATWQTLQPLIDASAGGGAGTPAALAYPQAQQQVSQFLTNPALQQQAIAGAQQGAGIGGFGAAQMVAGAGQNIANANTLTDAAGQVLNQGFDPQSALLGREQEQLLDRSNVVNAMSGVASTPYGASTTGNNLANFNINWDNQRLQRGQSGLASAGTGYGQAAGLEAGAGSLYTGATTLAGAAGGLPFSTGATIASDALQGLGSQTSLGNNQYVLPQQTITDLSNYMTGGQNASQISGRLGQLGLQEQANSLAGFGQLAGVGSNALFGSGGIGGTNGLLGTGGNGIGGLFGGGAAASGADFAALNTGIDAATLGAAPTVAGSSVGLGALVPAAGSLGA